MTSRVCAALIAEIAHDRSVAHHRAIRDSSKKGRTRRFRRPQAD
jgi:hypothetical protein